MNWVGLLLAFALSSQPSALSAQKTEEASLYLTLGANHGLPLSFAEDILPKLPVAFHRSATLAPAYYQARITLPELVAADEPSVAEAQARSRGWQGGTLWLHQPAFSNLSALSLAELPIDSASYLIGALVSAYLHRELAQESALGRLISQQSKDFAVSASLEAEADDPLGSYVLALGSYGGYIVALASELNRSDARRRAQGKTGICGLLGKSGGLPDLWRRSLSQDGFMVSVFSSNLGQRTAELPVADQRFVRDRVLAVAWTGDPVKDWSGRFCREE